MARPKIKARYQVVGPKLVKRMKTFSRVDKDTKSTVHETREIEEPMWMVHFPQGHVTRMNRKELEHHKLHLKPRMVDMNTGDVLDEGGDPYDLTTELRKDDNVFLDHDDEDDEANIAAALASVKSGTKRAQAEKEA